MAYAHIGSGHRAQTPFLLQSVVEVRAPEGQEGVWQRYVIAQDQGANSIVGLRAGEHDEVSLLVAQYVERLNVRLTPQKRKERTESSRQRKKPSDT